MYFLCTTSAEHVGKALVSRGEKVVFLGVNKDGKRMFPDGESYVRVNDIEKLSGERVVVLHAGQPDANNGLVELLFALDIIRNPVKSKHIEGKKYDYTALAKPKSVEVFFLYYPYGMQDKVFETGECVAAESVLKVIVSMGVSKVHVLDAHFEGAKWASSYPLNFVKAKGAIVEALKADGFSDAVIVAPDLGSQARLDISGFSKQRKNSFDVELSGDSNLEQMVAGYDVVVWDDLIETGGTMARAAEKIRAMGAKKVVAAATHGVMESGVVRVKGAYDKLYLGNSIANENSNVDVSEIVVRAVL